MTPKLSSFVGLFALAMLAGCESPADAALIDSLGDEQNGVREGEFHRYGQPCLACHGGFGPGPEFGVAGTVFSSPDRNVPVRGAKVSLTDASGQTKTFKTNCAGNFYADLGNFEPVFPMHAEVECTLPDGTVRRNVMGTRINRDGSCAGCHNKGSASNTGPAQVYCVAGTEEDPDEYELITGCEGGPAHD